MNNEIKQSFPSKMTDALNDLKVFTNELKQLTDDIIGGDRKNDITTATGPVMVNALSPAEILQRGCEMINSHLEIVRGQIAAIREALF